MRTYQQVLIIETTAISLRAKAVEWSCEDSSVDVLSPVNLTPPAQFHYQYETVLMLLVMDGSSLEFLRI